MFDEDTIKRANLDGSQVETLLSIPAPYDFVRSMALDVVDKKIYMSLYNAASNYLHRAIARANMDGSGYEILYEASGIKEGDVSGGLALLLP